MSLEHPETVEEAVHKHGLKCRLCTAQVMPIPNRSKSPRRYDQEKEGFIISYPIDHKVLDYKVCYYHNKVKKGIIRKGTN